VAEVRGLETSEVGAARTEGRSGAGRLALDADASVIG